jgi:hypothetical protein
MKNRMNVHFPKYTMTLGPPASLSAPPVDQPPSPAELGELATKPASTEADPQPTRFAVVRIRGNRRPAPPQNRDEERRAAQIRAAQAENRSLRRRIRERSQR